MSIFDDNESKQEVRETILGVVMFLIVVMTLLGIATGTALMILYFPWAMVGVALTAFLGLLLWAFLPSVNNLSRRNSEKPLDND